MNSKEKYFLNKTKTLRKQSVDWAILKLRILMLFIKRSLKAWKLGIVWKESFATSIIDKGLISALCNKVKKTDDTKCWWGCEATGTLIHCSRVKFV